LSSIGSGQPDRHHRRGPGCVVNINEPGARFETSRIQRVGNIHLQKVELYVIFSLPAIAPEAGGVKKSRRYAFLTWPWREAEAESFFI
jgi:hypothetical protein